MPAFAYRGRSASGELVQGTIESTDISAAAGQLSGGGITPVDIEPATARAMKSRPDAKAWLQPRVRPVDLLLFSRQFATLLRSGVPIMQALAGLQQSSSNETFQRVIGNVRESLESGHELSAALARESWVFSPFYIAMIRVGESTGRLDEVLRRLHDHIEFEVEMRSQVKAAVRYPVFVVIAMAIAIVIVNLFVIPAFAKVFKGLNAKLPVMTQILIDFSDFMVERWPLLLVGALAIGFAVRSWIRTPSGRLDWDRMKLRIPIAGRIVLKATLSRFSRSFALAVRSGVPVVAGLSLVGRTVDNEFMAMRIERMREGVERGESVLRTAVAAGFFTPVALQMIAVGEESGALDDLMDDVADLYQREVHYELKTLSAQIEPLLIVLLGVLVLVLALGIFLPMWDLSQAMFKR